MRLLFLCLSLWMVTLPAAAEPSERRRLPQLELGAAQNWLSVGRTRKDAWFALGFCSGTLIAPDVVLTAAHCANPGVWNNADVQYSFMIGVHESLDAGERKIVGSIRHPAYVAAGRHSPPHDVGLLFLDTPFADVEPLPHGFVERAEYALIGYNRYSPFRLAGRLDCPVLGRPGGLLQLDCPVESGNSGSPVFAKTETGWQLVAVVSSRMGDGALARPIGPWVEETIAAYRRGEFAELFLTAD